MAGKRGNLGVVESVEAGRFPTRLLANRVDGLVTLACDSLAQLAVLLFQLGLELLGALRGGNPSCFDEGFGLSPRLAEHDFELVFGLEEPTELGRRRGVGLRAIRFAFSGHEQLVEKYQKRGAACRG